MRIKDEIFCFAHLRWCHNGWASNTLVAVDSGYSIRKKDGLKSTTQNIGCPSIMTPLKMGKTKNLIFYSLSIAPACLLKRRFINRFTIQKKKTKQNKGKKKKTKQNKTKTKTKQQQKKKTNKQTKTSQNK